MMNKYLVLMLLIWLPSFLLAQTVTTLNTNSGFDDALIFDDQGRLYGSHYMGSSVFRLQAPEWNSSVFSTGYNTPNGLAFDKDGLLYMADNEGDRIYRIMSNGTKEVFVDSFLNPSGLIFELDSDTLIATSYRGSRIVKIGPDGGQRLFSAGGLLNGPVGLCFDDEGRLYTGNYNNRRIIRFDEAGNQFEIAQASGIGSLGFIVYAKGYIYGTLFSQHKIYRTDLMGNDTIILGTNAGTIDGGPGQARFTNPNGILASATQDTLYISDFGTRALRMITDLNPTTSVQQVENTLLQSVQLYPNPATSELQLELELRRRSHLQIQILDQQGRSVSSEIEEPVMGKGQHRIRLNIAHLPKGIYYVRIGINQTLIKRQAFFKF